VEFNIGDKVKIIDEKSEGTVVQFNKSKIIVEVDGLNFEYSAAEVLKLGIQESSLEKLYKSHLPNLTHIKTEDKPKTVKQDQKENAIELGRVRGKRNRKNIIEFDLHIHDLLVSHSHMTPGEMLNYQLDYAVNCLEESIKKGEPTIIFIHGIGKGVLKVELHNIIKAYGLDFHDGFMNEYGRGATRVELRA
jgi:dsDNA-specific endonuclease/ATPase MutS2|tara:strand:+ start:70 stop:642 length:573 start_codon:yes stop_codon:yes gene_type:complete